MRCVTLRLSWQVKLGVRFIFYLNTFSAQLTFLCQPFCRFHRFECQHIIHALQERGVARWVALSEGSGGTIGWLTVRQTASLDGSRNRC